jgi:phosphatidylserine/phosphatidylglycerophosphate/cardiolipin synthase-like enzyme
VFAVIGEAARTLDGSLVEHLAQRIEALPVEAGPDARLAAIGHIAPASARSVAKTVIDAWNERAVDLSPAAVAAALRAADAVDAYHRAEATLELVWTGPAPATTQLRRTDQALLEVIGAARNDLLLVSFAVHGAGALQSALLEALARGVRIRLVLESPEESRGRVDAAFTTWLGPQLAAGAERYVWPYEMREKVAGVSGEARFGVLHAKCAVADRRVLFLSSANLTDHALQLNMELGVLAHGGPLPGQVAGHFDSLVEAGLLVRA